VPTVHAKLLYALLRLSPDLTIGLATAVVDRVRKLRGTRRTHFATFITAMPQ
jgi:hypothetical protein